MNKRCPHCNLTNTTSYYIETKNGMTNYGTEGKIINECNNKTCGINLDTIVPVEFARQLETELADKDKLLAGAQELIKKLRRCANCKHKVEYVRFGCALDVNEEENQTCKNFDKWESEQ